LSQSFANNPLNGAKYLLRGMQLIWLPSIRPFTLIPLLLSTLVFAGLTYGVFSGLDSLVNKINSLLPSWLQWLDWLAWSFLGLSMVVFIFFTFTIVVNLLSAPFNGALSSAVEQHIQGSNAVQNDMPWHTILTTLPAVLYDEWKKIYYSLSRSIPFLILFFIPGINFLASPLWLLFGTWILALQYCDYPLGNHNHLFSKQRKILSQKRWLALGFGGAVMVTMMIPLVNFIIVPSAVAGATLMVLEHYQNTDT